MELTLATGLLAALLIGKGVSVLVGGVKALEWKRKMLYHRGAGIALWAVAVAWTLWEVTKLGPSDFGNFKGPLFVIFAGLGVASVWMLKDYLVVRAGAVIWLYTSWWLLKAAYLQEPWTRLIFVTVVYATIVGCLWLAVAPWRVRDVMDWMIKHKKARTMAAWGYVVVGGVLLVVALTYGNV